MKRIVLILLTITLVLGLSACNSDNTIQQKDTQLENKNEIFPNAKTIKLNGKSATLDGNEIKEYDYTWSFDPSMEAPEIADKIESDICYIAHDIIYYPEIDEDSFKLEEYDGEIEWVTHYTNEALKDYIFSTLPVLGTDLPKNMMHSSQEAYDNPVLHITEPGEYILEGEWNGQIYIDLGDKDDCFKDESKKVTLIMNGVDIKCTVAPAVVFYSLYECDNDWKNRTESTYEVDTSNAGAKVVLVDGTENNFSGANVYRILKAKYKNESTTVQKKYVKMDGAFYSFVSLEIDGNTGIMNITGSTYEGLDSELHLTINGGYINIVSQDDGINVNEDHISVFTLKGGRVTIFAGQGAQGDVVDSNGFINIVNGIIAGASPSVSDDVLDSDDGTYVSDNATVIENIAGFKGDMQRPFDRPEGQFNPNDRFGNNPMPPFEDGERPDFMMEMGPRN